MSEAEPGEIDVGEDDAEKDRRNRSIRLLVASYALDIMTKVVFQFVLVVFLSLVVPDSLTLVSAYGLNMAALVFLFGGRSGRFFDAGVANNRRLQSILAALTGQHSCVVACCALSYLLLSADDDAGASVGEIDSLTRALLVVIILLSGFAQLFNLATAASIEKDWIVVISGGDAECLGSINVKLKRVDLVSRTVGPLISGYFLTGFGERIESAFVTIGALDLVALLVNYKCYKIVCSTVPALMMQRGDENCDDPEGERRQGEFQNEEQQHGERDHEQQQPRHCTWCSMIGGYAIYFRQDIALAGVGESLLWLNAMSSGDVMTGYLLSRGLSASWVGVIRGCTATSGLVGTAAFDRSLGRHPLRAVAPASVAFQASCLTASMVGVLFVPGDTAAISTLVAGVIASRVGLYANILSVSQLTQLTVPEDVRGVVAGSQNSLNNLSFALYYACGLAWPDPAQFWVICVVSYSAVVSSFVLMLRGVYFSDAFKNV